MRFGPRSYQTKVLAVVGFVAFLSGCPDKKAKFINDPDPTPVTAKVLSVAVSPASASVAVGLQATFSASVSVQGTAASTVNWTAADGTVLLVVSSGSSATVTGLKVGATTVTATSTFDATMKASATVNVTAAAVTSIVISSASTSLLVGGTLQMQAVAKDAGGNTVPTPTLTWSSTIALNAGVSTTGLVTGLRAGTTSITASSGTVTSNAIALTIIPTSTVASWAPVAGLPSGYFNAIGNVRGLWSPGTSPVFAVTSSGEIGSWSGSAWTLVDQTTNLYNGISGSSATDIYAVGSNAGTAAVRMFNGASWSTMTIPPGVATLNSVWASGVGRAFAVGSNGAILRLQAGAWTTMASGATENLRGVWGSSETNVFAVGDNGVVLRFNGTVWSRTVLQFPVQLNAVWGRSTSYVVAVGAQGFISTFDGTTWVTAIPASANLNQLLAVAGDDVTGTVVASGASGTVLLGTVLNRPVWTSSSTPVTNATNTAAWRNDAVGVLVGWEIGGVSRRSTIGSWSVLTIAPGWNGVTAVSGTVAHAVGDAGAVATLNNGTWQVTPAGVGSNYVFHVQAWAASPTAVYAVRGTGVWRFDGSSWTPQYEPASVTAWLAVGGTSTSNVFAAGGGSGQMAQFNGSAWSPASPTPLAATEGLQNFGSSPSLVFGVGITGTIVRWRNGVWDRMTHPGTGFMLAVSIVDANNAFAVGSAGSILKYDGTNWTQMTSGTTAQLNGVWAASATEAYAVGAGGLILKWNGTSWSQMNSGTTRDLRAISGISGQYAVAVGRGGTIVMGSPTAASRIFSVRAMPIPAANPGMRMEQGPIVAPVASGSGMPRPKP